MIENFCQRPKSNKRYVHPPFSERLFTLWAEGKIMFGENDLNMDSAFHNEHRSYYQQMACGIFPLHGHKNIRFDHRTVKNIITEDGTPIHAVQYDTGSMLVTIECFCNTARKATLFGKIHVQNTVNRHLTDTITLVLRTGFESELQHGTSDGYVSYDQPIDTWLSKITSWRKDGNRCTDEIRVLTIDGPFQWRSKPSGAALAIELDPGEEAVWHFSLDMGETKSFDYEEEKAKTVAFWRKELQRINKLPKAVEKNPELCKAIRHWTTQLLQLIAVNKDPSITLPRQGGMQRVIWPTEALSHIEGLCRIGDFDDYLEPIFKTYFEDIQQPSGEIGPLGIYWGSMTAAALYSFAQYCNFTRNKAFFGKYREQAYKAFRFIKDLRRSVVDTDELAGGLFPILRGIDWTQQFQCWTSTDVFNVLGLDALADTFKAYSDPAADEIRTEHTEYLADMKRHYKKYYDAQAGLDTLRAPLKPVGDDKDLVDDLYPLLYQGRFVYCGIIDKEEDVLRVYNEMIKTGVTIEGLGLYGHMTYKDKNPNIWYLSFPDYYWFEIWMQYGYREKAKEILDAQMRYAMTEEYYFVERIDADDPYFAPWSPNASATGRTLIMLSKYYAD